MNIKYTLLTTLFTLCFSGSLVCMKAPSALYKLKRPSCLKEMSTEALCDLIENNKQHINDSIGKNEAGTTIYPISCIFDLAALKDADKYVPVLEKALSCGAKIHTHLDMPLIQDAVTKRQYLQRIEGVSDDDERAQQWERAFRTAILHSRNYEQQPNFIHQNFDPALLHSDPNYRKSYVQYMTTHYPVVEVVKNYNEIGTFEMKAQLGKDMAQAYKNIFLQDILNSKRADLLKSIYMPKYINPIIEDAFNLPTKS